MSERELSLDVTPAAKDYIVDNGYVPIYGARPLKRFIQSDVETLLAKKILSDNVAPGTTLTVDVGENGLIVK
ncbi:MAG: hypothetical protein ACLUSP_04970 [Christensenellales bacterium]